MRFTFVIPTSACVAQNSAVLLPSVPYDAVVLQPSTEHTLKTTLIIPALACGEQKIAVILPPTP